MKFGKIIQHQVDDAFPEWREKFLSYKRLKKRLKAIKAPVCFTKAVFVENDGFTSSEFDGRLNAGEPGDFESSAGKRNAGQLMRSDSKEDRPKKRIKSDLVVELPACANKDRDRILCHDKEFVRMLNIELDKFNNFFMEKEEEYVIRLHQLKERIGKLKAKYHEDGIVGDRTYEEECTRIQLDIVAFHGEMVLLENYSSLNYIGLVKILKKHDKRTGAVLRMPFIVSVLHQPFYSTKLLSKLVHECHECANSIRSLLPSSIRNEAVVEEGVIEDASLSHAMESEPIHRQTLAALRTIQAMRKA